MSDATAATAETPEATPAPELTEDQQALVDFIDKQVGEINAMPKKSNYHGARKSAFRQIRDLIVPPAPKPEKAPKAKKAKAGAAPAAPAASTPEVEGDLQMAPNEEVA